VTLKRKFRRRLRQNSLGGLEESLFGSFNKGIRTVVALSSEVVVVDGPEHDSSQALGGDVTSLNNKALVNSSAFVPTPVNRFHSRSTLPAVLCYSKCERGLIMSCHRRVEIFAQQNKQNKVECVV
jgi:hypothetical protein